jgi:hypothetical protein
MQEDETKQLTTWNKDLENMTVVWLFKKFLDGPPPSILECNISSVKCRW